jgi:protein-L-isoaspartate O-methyltransferase
MASRKPAERPSRAKQENRPVLDTFVVPSKRKLYRITSRWAPPSEVHRQAIVPKDPRLLEKLGIEKGERILVFAGCYGDWASALARTGAKVTYTDSSPRMAKYAKRRFKKSRVEGFRARDAALQPRRKNLYDWSFSFQPIPLEHKALPFALIRSLLNKKGAIIASFGSASWDLALIAKVYGASLNLKAADISNIGGEPNGVAVATLRTNHKAQAMAGQDLRVQNAIEKLDSINYAELAKKLGLSEKQIEESIRRLRDISNFSERFVLENIDSRKWVR